MTHSIEHQMTEIYCFVDDYLKAHPHQARWRRSPHAVPRFTDAEVLTIGLLQGVFQVASLKQTYRLVRANFQSAFPRLASYAEWLRRLHQLSVHVGLLLEATCASPINPSLYLIDSKPIPLLPPIAAQASAPDERRWRALWEKLKGLVLRLQTPCAASYHRTLSQYRPDASLC
jgi:hypothetical protein